VPKHRRSEIEQPRASVWAPANTAEDWPEAVGYGQFAHPEPGWAASPQEHSWQELEEWQNWGPPPAMHPDHPSAPVPRVQFPDDYPSGPMSAPRTSGLPDLPNRRPGGSARTWNQTPQTPHADFDNGNRRLYAVPDGAAAGLAGPDWPERVNFQTRQGSVPREADSFQPQSGPSGRDAIGYQRQTFPGWQEPSDYWTEAGEFQPGRGPATVRFEDGPSASRDSHRAAGQVLTLADGRAARMAQEAQDYAASIREAAEREAASIREAAQRAAAAVTEQATCQAAAIREAAEREAAELRTRFDSVTGELGRVTAYLTETLAAPAMLAIAPPLPEVTPAPTGTRPAPPATRPAKPATRPTGPRTAPTSQPHEPGTKTAKPGSAPRTRTATPGTAPRTRPDGPARQTATPAKQGQALGRQRRAMRIATAGTAALLSIAAIGSVTYTGIHGFSFFVFRESGQGETPGNFTDAKFLARQAAAQHHDSAPKGRHHKATGSQ
jgi:hypothetical protein